MEVHVAPEVTQVERALAPAWIRPSSVLKYTLPALDRATPPKPDAFYSRDKLTAPSFQRKWNILLAKN